MPGAKAHFILQMEGAFNCGIVMLLYIYELSKSYLMCGNRFHYTAITGDNLMQLGMLQYNCQQAVAVHIVSGWLL